jgi:hypothetical protein
LLSGRDKAIQFIEPVQNDLNLTGHFLLAASSDHQKIGGPGIYDMLTSYGKKLGTQVRYDTQAVQLIRPQNRGRVTGVAVKNRKGGYSQFIASKAVIICTGDYGSNLTGGFWGDSYPMSVLPGLARGKALTFGRLAGLHAAKA